MDLAAQSPWRWRAKALSYASLTATAEKIAQTGAKVHSFVWDLAAEGVTANIIVPGRIATARTAFLDSAKAKREGRELTAVEQESASSIPVGRYGRPEEYADAVAFLASERAAYITGTMLRVDGGLIPAV